MKHETLEKNATLLLIFSFLVVTIGGLVQIVPLFYLQNTIENVEGMRPYSPPTCSHGTTSPPAYCPGARGRASPPTRIMSGCRRSCSSRRR